MNLESKIIPVNKSNTEVFEFLTKVKNYKSLMPDNTKFELLDETTFLFALKGMPEIVLKLKECQAHHSVKLGSAGGKIDFTLQVILNSVSVDNCEIQLKFEGQFNPMMSMMIKGPISKFIDTLGCNIPLNI